MISESFILQEKESNVYNLNGEVVEKIKLPEIFNEELRLDLIQRAVVSELANRRQKYGTDKLAGLRTSADYFAVRRRTYRITIGRDISRLPRIKPGGGGLGAVRIVPNAVKGRAAHPPKVEKSFDKKINKKEYIKALRSAISNVNLIIVDDAYEKIDKTKQAENFIGLLKDKKILNSDKILLIVNENKKQSENLNMNVKKVSEVTVYDFAQGATRLIDNVIITKSALQNLKI